MTKQIILGYFAYFVFSVLSRTIKNGTTVM